MTQNLKEYTPSEQSLVDGFAKKIATLADNAPSIKARQAAAELFARKGLPSRKWESWHFTDLKTILKSVPSMDSASDSANNAGYAPIALPVEKFVIANGALQSYQDSDLVHVSDLAQDIEKGVISLDKALADDDFIGQINTAYVSDGINIDIKDNSKLVAPIELQNVQTNGQSHVRYNLNVGKNAKLTLIERQISNDQESLTSSVANITVDENSALDWIIIREEGAKAFEFGQLNAIIKKGVNLRIFVINAGPLFIRQEINVDLVGEEADFQLRAMNLLAHKNHGDITMTVRHLVENTTSTELVRNVLSDESAGVFQGMIKVAKEAQKTDARMACNTLILSDNAKFSAKPELEIFADDVACGHGATVAEIDHEQLFYLMSRGISRSQARGLLVKAFVSQLLDDLEDETLKEALSQKVDQWLVNHI